MPELYLASQSPRRHALLTQIGLQFEQVCVVVDERAKDGERPGELVRRLARDKAQAGTHALRLRRERNGVTNRNRAAVIGADTVVVRDQAVLGKPADSAAAHTMLASLSGRSHQVMTAMALACEDRVATRLSISEVTFRHIEPAELAAYVATGEPLDKAGAYGIQGLAGVFVTELRGSYSGVMGLALHHVDELLRGVGVAVVAP